MTLALLNMDLIESAKCGDFSLCLDLLSRGADSEARLREDRTALGWAARNGRTSTCMALLVRGADIESLMPLVRLSNNDRAESVLRSWLAARQARAALDGIFGPSPWMECAA